MLQNQYETSGNESCAKLSSTHTRLTSLRAACQGRSDSRESPVAGTSQACRTRPVPDHLPAVEVVELQRPVVEKERAGLEPHVPRERADGVGHLRRLVLGGRAVLLADGIGHGGEHPVRDHADLRGERRRRARARLRPVERQYRGGHVRRPVRRRAPVLLPYRVRDVGEHRLVDQAKSHQKLTPLRSGNCSATHTFVA